MFRAVMLAIGIVWGSVGFATSGDSMLQGPPMNGRPPASCHYANPDVPAWGIECSYPNNYPTVGG